jgi:phage anti-repressor protein
MRTNISNNVGHADGTLASIINVYINNRYRQVQQRYNTQTIDEDYSFPTVSGTQDYDMPTDFGKEIYVYDATNKYQLASATFQELVDQFPSTLDSSGTATLYSVYEKIVASVRTKRMRLYPTPSAAVTIKVPYIVKATDLSNNTDIPIIECEDGLELGATADTFRYLKQYAKATDFENLFERWLSDYIWSQENNPNRVTLFNPKPYDRETV